jgi:hypothetical protein
MKNGLGLVLEMNSLLKDDVVNGFSYSFSAALLKKLKQLKKDDNLFKYSNTDHIQGPVTDIAEIVMHHLRGQISEHILPEDTPNDPISLNEVDRFILLVEEFLAIFQAKAKKAK